MPSSLSVSDDDEDMKSAEDISQPNNKQPEKKKIQKRTDGHEDPQILVEGNDPFDYEQKFPEDKQYEELGPTARV
ncbi:hypothetical protein ARMSODRAFT_1013973 [Armillaria solidipes]|uniref:Uncharacterized protein n=1 Tax=Armillaria solidipes TaxID=1076256 RepID=A0A2H3CFS3_9AGAR|nr:hypothetical protein ARMSODRAFT_1013973 [Armillaria solidipes]